MTLETLGLLALIFGVGAACYYAGWKSAHAYLPAAQSVSDVAAAAVQQSNNYASSLDRTEAALTSLRSAIDTNTRTLDERHHAIEDSILALFQGLERAGLARSPRTVARQVGETAPE